MKKLFLIVPAASLILASCGGAPSGSPGSLQGSYILDEENSPVFIGQAKVIEEIVDPDDRLRAMRRVEKKRATWGIINIDGSDILQIADRFCKITDVNSIQGVKCGSSLADLTDEKLADPERRTREDLTITLTSDGFRLTDREGIDLTYKKE
ncbi:MAG: hypothetical protein DCO98_00160 [Altererythrobacter sp. XM-24bin4]|uniref:hypothetical protein n=1 Tax=uncultured Altererythrobacter sp. TaxID=500840 RepID=UPI000D796BE6|nr:hypothetical protein [uncultured Altererythrobacter sp.]PWL24850.1 MAG: hypothetical protein DCO98_00160 [Altererythrobacter sp. XM-24bin4]